ncbi:MAG: nucleotidyltransferase domain-containing protein [Candidatus Brennerbacteria bacterium]|nr:nucleotidyltransferase domain-containing protein [Candidatus Brennerbacteria bacterium]
MEKFIQKICSEVVDQYKPDKNVLGILLFGSVARNKFDTYSDVDIYILLSQSGKFSRSNFIKNGVRVDIIFNTWAEAKKYLKEDRNGLRRITSHMLAHGRILFQRRRSLERIQIVARDNLKLKAKYKNGEVLMHKYSIDDFWGEVQRDIKGKDYLAFGIDSHLLITNIVELFLKLSGEFLRQPNEMRKILKRTDRKFSNQVEHFYKASSIEIKKMILSGLVKHIYKKSGGPLPARWFLEE